MIGLLHAVLRALAAILEGQDRAALQAAVDTAAVLAAVEHVRSLIEDDTLPAEVGAPTFTPTGD